MPSGIVISDASTIIGLVNINRLYLLAKLYDSIEVTSIVYNEISLELPKLFSISDDYNEDAN